MVLLYDIIQAFDLTDSDGRAVLLVITAWKFIASTGELEEDRSKRRTQHTGKGKSVCSRL
jgi:hypothetical protein